MVALPFGPTLSADDLTEDHKGELRALLEGLGYRELAAAFLFGAGLRLAPTLDDKLVLGDQANEELAHFESVAATYAEAGLGDLLRVVEPRAAALPSPASWVELVLAEVLFDRASCMQLAGHHAARYAPYAQLVAKIAREEERHLAACEATLREAFAARPEAFADAQRHVERWLRLSLDAFGRALFERRDGSTLGVPLDTSRVVADYLHAVRAILADVGLRLSTRAELRLDLPGDLPLD